MNDDTTTPGANDLEGEESLDDVTAKLELEAKRARSRGLWAGLFDRGAVNPRHIKKNGRRVEVRGRLPHLRHPRAARNMMGYRKKALCNQRQIDGETRRRQQDRADAAAAVMAGIALGALPKPTSQVQLEGLIQEATRQLVESRGGF